MEPLSGESGNHDWIHFKGIKEARFNGAALRRERKRVLRVLVPREKMASMEPLSRESGNPTPGQENGRSAAASMEPLSGESGNASLTLWG